jgi:UDP-glucose 4-epimerase
MLLLATGARGAIGRYVVAAARARGYHVAGIGHGAWTGDVDLPPIDHWINGSIDADNLDRLAHDLGPPDAVVHLAGGSLVGTSISQPGEDFRRTVESAQRLLEWLRTTAPAARLVIASSAAVYGDAHPGPIPESAPHAPTSPYGTHKAMVELMASSYARQFQMPVAMLRLFSVYGPCLRKQLIWELAGRIIKGERSLALGGTGEERRDFVFVTDAAEMLLDAMTLASPTAPVFNAASGVATRITDLAGLIAERLGGAKVAFSGHRRRGDPFSLVADCSAADPAGLTAKVPLADGLTRTVAWITAASASEGLRR